MQLNVTLTEIQSLATNGKVYSEAKAYANENHVNHLAFDMEDRRLDADVLSMDQLSHYKVKLWLNNRDRPRKVSCTCEASSKFIGCCKHQVALMLFALNTRLDRLPGPAEMARTAAAVREPIHPALPSATGHISPVRDTAKAPAPAAVGHAAAAAEAPAETRQPLRNHRQTLEMMRRLQAVLAVKRGENYSQPQLLLDEDPDAAESDRPARGLLRQLDLKVTVQLPTFSSEMSALEARIGFQGERHYYKVKSFEELLDALDSGKSLVFGKELTLRPDRQYFNEASRALVDWLMFLYHNQTEKQAFQYQPGSTLFRKNQVILNAARLYQLLRLCTTDARGIDLSFEPYAGKAISPRIREEWPPLRFLLRPAPPEEERQTAQARAAGLTRSAYLASMQTPEERLDVLELLLVEGAAYDEPSDDEDTPDTENRPVMAGESADSADTPAAEPEEEESGEEALEEAVAVKTDYTAPAPRPLPAPELTEAELAAPPVRAFTASNAQRPGALRSLRLLTRDASVMLYGGEIYLTPRDERAVAALFRSLAEVDESRLLLGPEEAGLFMSQMLPLVEPGRLALAPEVSAALLREPLKAAVWLDKEGNGVTARVEFRYGEHRIDPHPLSARRRMAGLEAPYRWQLRDENAELKVLDALQLAGFQDQVPARAKSRTSALLASPAEKKNAESGEAAAQAAPPPLYFLFGDKKIYSFLTAVLPVLQEAAEIFYSDRFRRLNIRRFEPLRGQVRLQENSDLLAIDVEDMPYSPQDLSRILEAYREKRKYVRLKDGEFLTFDELESDGTLDILAEADGWGGRWEEKTLYLPKYRAVPLQQLLAAEAAAGGETLVADSSIQELTASLMDPSRLNFEVPAELKATLRPYQTAGFQWLSLLDYYGFGGILADDMGLGKTLQALTYILHKKLLRARAGLHPQPALVVAPTSLIYNWQDEARHFTPGLRTVVIEGSKDKRLEAIASLGTDDLAVCSYTVMRQDLDELMRYQFSVCFLDEAQYIKNPRTQTARSVKKIRADRCFALTGTPIENKLSELWSIFDFLMPGYLFSLKHFHDEFELPIARGDAEGEEASAELRRLVRPFILRRMKSEVLKELPDKIETVMRTDMEEEQLKLYLAYLAQARSTFEEMVENQGFEHSQIQILALLTRLRQIACHPGLFLEDYAGGSGKLEALEEHLDNLLSSSHRVLLFSQFTSMLEIIRKRQEKAGRRIFYIDGSVPARERLDQVDRFNSGEGEIFLISLKAGGTGLNLTGADTVIHYDPWWNPAVEQQATDRAHRIGQRRVVQIFRMVSRGTIEEKIIELQQEKSRLADQVIQPGENFLKQMKLGEIRDLLSFEAQ